MPLNKKKNHLKKQPHRKYEYDSLTTWPKITWDGWYATFRIGMINQIFFPSQIFTNYPLSAPYFWLCVTIRLSSINVYYYCDISNSYKFFFLIKLFHFCCWDSHSSLKRSQLFVSLSLRKQSGIATVTRTGMFSDKTGEFSVASDLCETN